ncbi:MAG: hypothetical protein R2815_13940 [Flavobacteriales bacterium]
MAVPWRSPSWLSTVVVVVFVAMVSVSGLWRGADGRAWKDTIRSDAKGYYSYLTSIFLRGDPGHEPDAWEYIQHTPTGTLNKYFCGTAIAMAPWFAVGHGLALLDPEAPRDGYSEYEMKAISIGGWVYLWLGLIALRALLLRMGVREAVVVWIILGLGLGTPLVQYTAIQPGWSHVYSFCAITTFLLLVHHLSTGAALRWLVVAAALLGLIILIRPVNGLVLLAVPVVAGADTLALLARAVERWWMLLLALVAGVAVLAVQPLLWHVQTGNWFEWGYRNEGFYWDRPMVREVLFGIRRGLFVWSPVLLPAAAAAFLLWRKAPVRSAFSLLYWTANTYVISCWWIWYYGSGFASRVYIDHYPVLVIPLALVLQHAGRGWWHAARWWMALCIVLHLFQYAQYRKGILHHEHMDAEKYAWAWGRMADADAGRLGGRMEEAPYHPHGMDVVITESTDLERPTHYWAHGDIRRHPHAFSRERVCVYNAHNEFGVTFTAPPGSIPLGRELFLQVGMQRYEAKAGDAAGALAITTVVRPDGSSSFYNSFRIDPVPGTTDRTWRALEFAIPVPALKQGEELIFYLWNQHRTSRFLIDDVMMRVSAVRPE